MRFARFLAPALALTLASAAAAHYFGVVDAVPAYTTYKNIRTVDGRLNPLDLTTDPQGAQLYADDGTGFTLTAPSTATAIADSALTLCDSNVTRGGAVCGATTGKLTFNRSGLYRVKACITDGVGANTATITLDVQEQIGAGSSASLGKGSTTKTITLTAQPWIPICSDNIVKVSGSDATSTAIFKGVITASTGNVTIKRYQLQGWKIDELTPATPCSGTCS